MALRSLRGYHEGMKNALPLLAALILAAACSKPDAPAPESSAPAASAPAASAPTTAAEPAAGVSEKEKALANPYPNDLGPERLTDAQLSGYSPELRAGYELLTSRCAQCHSPARPLNSRFVEVTDAELAKLKKSAPALLADRSVRQVEPMIWNRYVKRMMNKPGCAIKPAEGKAIWRFLAEDGRRRKLGENAAAWEAHRKRLLSEFKAKHPKRFAELAAAGDL